MTAIETILASSEIKSAREWQGKRAYLTLRGCDWSYRGDKNTTVYLDLVTGKLVYEPAKNGIVSTPMRESMEALNATAAACGVDVIGYK